MSVPVPIVARAATRECFKFISEAMMTASFPVADIRELVEFAEQFGTFALPGMTQEVVPAPVAGTMREIILNDDTLEADEFQLIRLNGRVFAPEVITIEDDGEEGIANLVSGLDADVPPMFEAGFGAAWAKVVAEHPECRAPFTLDDAAIERSWMIYVSENGLPVSAPGIASREPDEEERRFETLVERIAAWTDDEVAVVSPEQVRKIARLVVEGAYFEYTSFGGEVERLPISAQGVADVAPGKLYGLSDLAHRLASARPAFGLAPILGPDDAIAHPLSRPHLGPHGDEEPERETRFHPGERVTAGELYGGAWQDCIVEGMSPPLPGNGEPHVNVTRSDGKKGAIEASKLTRVVEVPAQPADEWGAEIAVDGKPPAWLAYNDEISWRSGRATGICPADELSWAGREGTIAVPVEAIRLPASHPYYVATSRGFTYWPGGDDAPADWDPKAEVLFRCGNSFIGRDWRWQHRHANPSDDIIGYRAKPAELSGTRGDRVIIDDPHAEATFEQFAAASRAFHDTAPTRGTILAKLRNDAKRDEFAKAALTGAMQFPSGSGADYLAGRIFDIADAMLAESEKRRLGA